MPAVPEDPVTAILHAFDDHNIVALSEGPHGNLNAHKLRCQLIRDARVPGLINDIVVEFGNSRYQRLMDRFIAGQRVEPRELRHVWEDTTAPYTTWDVPIYQEFFDAVRDVNAHLPMGKRFRVLLADPPVDWRSAHSSADLLRWFDERDEYAAKLVQTEVLARGRKALLVFGNMHLLRTDFLPPAQQTQVPRSLVQVLETDPRAHIFNIWTGGNVALTSIQPDVASWHVPSLTTIRETILGTTSFSVFAGNSVRWATDKGTGSIGNWAPHTMQDQFDAILDLGPPTSIRYSHLTRTLCDDPAYVRMRLSRLALAPLPPDAPKPTAMLKAECSSASN